MLTLSLTANVWPPATNGSFFLHLPTELLILITDELDQESLCMLLQTCHQLLETAVRQYLTKSGFKNTADRDWRSFRDWDCELLLVWRHMGLFKLLSTIWFSGSQFMGDHQFRALTVFFHLLQRLGSMHQVYISLYQGPIEPSLALISCLESITESGCESLHCLSRPYLRQKPPSNGQGISCASNL